MSSQQCLEKNTSWIPANIAGALVGILCVGASLKYNSSRALVIDHRLCPSLLDFFPDKPPAECNAVLIENSLEREIMLVSKLRSGYK